MTATIWYSTFRLLSGIWDPKNMKITVYRTIVVACCFVFVSKLVCNNEGRKTAEGFWEQVA